MEEKLKLALRKHVDEFTEFKRCQVCPFILKMKMYILLAQKIYVVQWY